MPLIFNDQWRQRLVQLKLSLPSFRCPYDPGNGPCHNEAKYLRILRENNQRIREKMNFAYHEAHTMVSQYSYTMYTLENLREELDLSDKHNQKVLDRKIRRHRRAYEEVTDEMRAILDHCNQEQISCWERFRRHHSNVNVHMRDVVISLNRVDDKD